MPAWGLASGRRHVLVLLPSAILLVLALYYLYGPEHPGFPLVPAVSKYGDAVAGPTDPVKGVLGQQAGLVPKPELPPEYLDWPDDRKRCYDFFTTSYLHYVAEHQQPYCEPQSLGAFQCFAAQRLDNPWTPYYGNADHLCVAQGVSFHPNGLPTKPEAQFGVQCQPRDLASERQASPQAAQQLELFPDLAEFKWYWGDTGVGMALRTWELQDHGDKSGCTSSNSSGDWTILMHRDSTDPHNIWHKLLEIMQARHSVDALRIAINPATGAPWLSADAAERALLVFDDDRDEILEPLWQIVTGRPPARKSQLDPGACLGNVLLPLPGAGSPLWTELMHPDFRGPCYAQTLLTTFTDRVLHFYGVEPRRTTATHAHPAITIIERPQNRKIVGLEGLVAKIKAKYPDSEVKVVDFTGLDFKDQLQLVQATDVLIGHHGAAMTHVIHLSPEAAAVEILPPRFAQHGFRAIARMRGVSYFSAESLWEEEYENQVHGKPLPPDWKAPTTGFNDWQTREWAYITEENFLGVVDAAVRSQQKGGG